MTTFTCTLEEFRKLAGEFGRATRAARTIEELEAGHKCLALHYLGVQGSDADIEMAALILKVCTRPYLERLVEFQLAERRATG